jgi:hypothetical protein
VKSMESHGSLSAFEIESDAGRDVRRELAAAVVARGWGLLELRPLRASLEDVFLQLLTDDGSTADSGPAERTPEDGDGTADSPAPAEEVTR